MCGVLCCGVSCCILCYVRDFLYIVLCCIVWYNILMCCVVFCIVMCFVACTVCCSVCIIRSMYFVEPIDAVDLYCVLLC